MPHYFADVTGIISINGVIKLSMNASKAGANDKDLSWEDLPIGTEVTFHKVMFHTSLSKKSGKVGVYGNAERIEISPVKLSPSEVEREDLLFQKISSECPGVGLQSARSMMGSLGTHLVLFDTFLAKDALKVKSMFMYIIETLSDQHVGVGNTWEQPLVSDAALKTMKAVVLDLEEFIMGNRGADIFFLSQMMALDTTEYQNVAVTAFGMKPSHAKAINAFESGMGGEITGIRMFPEHVPKTNNVFADALLSPSTKSLVRSDDDKKLRSIGAFSIDVSAFSVAMRPDDDTEFTFYLPKLNDGSSVVPKTFKLSPKTGVMKDKLGVFDFFRSQMCFHEIVKFANIMFFTEFKTSSSPFLTDRQPTVRDDEWGNANFTTNYIGVAGAISRVGIRVNEAFVKQYAVDEDGLVECIPNWHEIGEQNVKKNALLSPTPPKLEHDGYWALSGVADVNFASRMKRAVNPKLEHRFYVIFEGCADDVANKPYLNYDTSAGAQYITTKFAEHDIAQKLKEVAIVYAVSFSVKPNKRTVDDDDDERHSSSEEDDLVPNVDCKKSE